MQRRVSFPFMVSYLLLVEISLVSGTNILNSSLIFRRYHCYLVHGDLSIVERAVGIDKRYLNICVISSQQWFNAPALFMILRKYITWPTAFINSQVHYRNGSYSHSYVIYLKC